MITIKVPSQAARNFLACVGAVFAGDHGNTFASSIMRQAHSDLMEHARIEAMWSHAADCDRHYLHLWLSKHNDDLLPSAIGACD